MYLLLLFRPRIDMRLNRPRSLTFLHARSAAYVGVVVRTQGYFSSSFRMSAQMSISFLSLYICSPLTLVFLPPVAIAHFHSHVLFFLDMDVAVTVAAIVMSTSR